MKHIQSKHAADLPPKYAQGYHKALEMFSTQVVIDPRLPVACTVTFTAFQDVAPASDVIDGYPSITRQGVVGHSRAPSPPYAPYDLRKLTVQVPSRDPASGASCDPASSAPLEAPTKKRKAVAATSAAEATSGASSSGVHEARQWIADLDEDTFTLEDFLNQPPPANKEDVGAVLPPVLNMALSLLAYVYDPKRGVATDAVLVPATVTLRTCSLEVVSVTAATDAQVKESVRTHLQLCVECVAIVTHTCCVRVRVCPLQRGLFRMPKRNRRGHDVRFSVHMLVAVLILHVKNRCRDKRFRGFAVGADRQRNNVMTEACNYLEYLQLHDWAALLKNTTGAKVPVVRA